MQKLIETLRKSCMAQRRSMHSVCNAAGEDKQSLSVWVGKRKCPSLGSFIAVAETLGYDLVLIPKEK